MGDCDGCVASTGGMYRSYAVLQGIDQLFRSMFIFPVVPHARRPAGRIDEIAGENFAERSFRNQKPELAEKLEEALA